MLLLLCVCVSFPVVLCDLSTFHPTLNAPYAGTLGGVLLDIDVLPCVAGALDSITVTIPQVPSKGQTNAYFQGPAFQDRSITGISIHGAHVYRPTSLLVSWDGISQFTFRGFSNPGAAGVMVPAIVNIPVGSPDPAWVNVNWYIPDLAWVDPTIDGFIDNDQTKIPIKLVAFTPGTSPSVTLTKQQYFNAINNPDITCTQTQA